MRLFPSTHPHLPPATGKIPYTAALATSPVAWGRVPVVGNVKLIIESERIMRNHYNSNSNNNSNNDASDSFPNSTSPSNSDPDWPAPSSPEKFVVRWKTCRQAKGEMTDYIQKAMSILGRETDSQMTQAGSGESERREFHGIFVFEFDQDGKILAHTIEHVQEGSNYERTAKAISLADWLLGLARRKGQEEVPGLAYFLGSGSKDRRKGDAR